MTTIEQLIKSRTSANNYDTAANFRAMRSLS